jgi:methylmalonyl-CoA epimerase
VKIKATLDHIGIAVSDLGAALTFFRDALGLEVEPPEDVPSQRVRVHYVETGATALELLEATSPDSPIAKFVEKRGPGLHHITLRVAQLDAALAHLKSRGVRLIDETPRAGSHHSRIAFVHPSSTHGLLVELKEDAVGADEHPATPSMARRTTIGDLELISLSDGWFRLDGGGMFGIVPKALWAQRAAPDAQNRIRMGLRPIVVRGVRTMLIDAGIGDKMDAKRAGIYGFERARHLDHALAEAGLTPEAIDVVLATHLHFDHAGGFTMRRQNGSLVPRFPRAQYIVRRGEWEEALTPNERTRGSYFRENYAPLAEAGVLQLVDEDTTIMPGVRVRRTGGHTRDHQIVYIESKGRTAVFAADLIPTTAHLNEAWIMGYDLFPLETLAFKKAFIREAIEREYLVFFEHDPEIAAGYIRERDGKRTIERAL